MPKFFIITGFPRSRTAWFSALFSQNEVICFHEPSLHFEDLEIMLRELEQLDYEYVGISDSSIGLTSQFYIDNFKDAPIVVIDRKQHEAKASLIKFLSMQENVAEVLINAVFNGILKLAEHRKVKYIKFEELSNNEAVKEMWEYLIPDKKFDNIRCNMFQKLVINQKI